MAQAKTPTKKLSQPAAPARKAASKKTQLVTNRKAAATRKKKKPLRTKAKTPVRASRKSTTKAASTPLPTLLPVVTPITMSAPALPSSLATTATTPAYKDLPMRGNRLQLWLAVMSCTVIIAVIWIYLLQRNWQTVPATMSDSIENIQVDELVGQVKDNYGDLKKNVEEMSALANDLSNGTAETNTNTNINSSTEDELNNLFSDLQ